MRVLVFNPGSNSLKFQIVDIQTATREWGRKLVQRAKECVEDHGDAAAQVLLQIEKGEFKSSEIGSLSDIDLIACRVVHGADRFRGPMEASPEILAAIEALDDLAPLHNKNSVSIIRACTAAIAGRVAIVAVFDSAFHATLPEVAYSYAIPFELAQRHGIRRYGFHGISHKYLMLRYAELNGIPLQRTNIITLHLEGGSSATAIKNGRSIDTSMGFTPLEGLVMSTRCGDLDPALVGFLSRKEDVPVSTVEQWLNKKSGLQGISGVSPDTRVLVKQMDRRSQLALDVFAYRVSKYIGAYTAAMDGADAVVFGGGIGENTPDVRRRICSTLGWLGLDMDPERNAHTIDREGCISRDGSRLRAFVIPTEEGLMMARDAVDWHGRHPRPAN